jgi:hypothetical protein
MEMGGRGERGERFGCSEREGEGELDSTLHLSLSLPFLRVKGTGGRLMVGNEGLGMGKG